jgi:hypothetical protein
MSLILRARYRIKGDTSHHSLFSARYFEHLEKKGYKPVSLFFSDFFLSYLGEGFGEWPIPSHKGRCQNSKTFFRPSWFWFGRRHTLLIVISWRKRRVTSLSTIGRPHLIKLMSSAVRSECCSSQTCWHDLKVHLHLKTEIIHCISKMNFYSLPLCICT